MNNRANAHLHGASKSSPVEDEKSGVPQAHLLTRVSRRFSLGALLCFGFALFYSLYNWLPLLDAKWSLIDDHEIVAVIGLNDKLPISEIPAALGKTEIANTGGSVRFRPSYYTLRFLEAATWGKQPQFWYASRIAISVLFALVLTSLCLRLGGSILTFGFLFFELSRPYWADIFSRLGPAETYAVFGLSLIMLGFIASAKRRWSALSCAVIALGIVIAAGSKENFIILAALPLWLFFSPAVRLSLVMKSIFGIVLVYLGWIFITVFRRVQHAGYDVYERPVSIESRFGLLHSLATRPDVLVWLSICLSLLVLVYVLKNRDEQMRVLSKSLNGYIWAMLVLLLVFAIQYVFYFGAWPRGAAPRYLFPGVFGQHFAIFLAVVIVAKIISVTSPWLRGRSWIVLLAAASCFLTFSVKNFATNRAASKTVVANTISFTSKLKEAFDFLRMNPSAALILNSNNVSDYEPLFSIERFVRASGLTNPVALKLNGYSPEAFSKDSQRLAFSLAGTLEEIQKFGKAGFVPLRTVETIAACFSMGMSGPPLASCESGNIIRP